MIRYISTLPELVQSRIEVRLVHYKTNGCSSPFGSIVAEGLAEAGLKFEHTLPTQKAKVIIINTFVTMCTEKHSRTLLAQAQIS